MVSMRSWESLYDVCEDALLSALEDGHRPPKRFRVYLEGRLSYLLRDEMTIEVAGYSMTVLPESAPKTEGAA